LYTQDEIAAVKREPNIYEHIFFIPLETGGKFRVEIPHATYRPVLDTLSEAMEARDRMLASPHFPQAKRYEPRREYATYCDPNLLETRTYDR
jgi:hypothetical protein